MAGMGGLGGLGDAAAGLFGGDAAGGAGGLFGEGHTAMGGLNGLIFLVMLPVRAAVALVRLAIANPQVAAAVSVCFVVTVSLACSRCRKRRQKERAVRAEAHQRERANEKERCELRELTESVSNRFQAEAERSKDTAKWSLKQSPAGSVRGEERAEVTVLAADGATAYVGTAGGAVVALTAHSSNTRQSRTELCAGGKNPVVAMALAPDGRTLFSAVAGREGGGGGAVTAFALPGGECLGTFAGHHTGGGPSQLAASADSAVLYSDQLKEPQEWVLSDGRSILMAGVEWPAFALAPAPQGSDWLCAARDGIYVDTNARQGVVLLQREGTLLKQVAEQCGTSGDRCDRPSSLVVTPDGNMVLCGQWAHPGSDDGCRIYGFSLPGLRPVLICDGMPKKMAVTAMAVAPNGRSLFAAAVGSAAWLGGSSAGMPLQLYAFALPPGGERGLAALEEQLHSYKFVRTSPIGTATAGSCVCVEVKRPAWEGRQRDWCVCKQKSPGAVALRFDDRMGSSGSGVWAAGTLDVEGHQVTLLKWTNTNFSSGDGDESKKS